MLLTELETVGENYYVNWYDGTAWQRVFGTRTGQAQSLQVTEVTDDTVGYAPVMAQNGLVGYTETEDGLQLSYYDLESGTRSAQVELTGLQTPTAIHSPWQILYT